MEQGCEPNQRSTKVLALNSCSCLPLIQVAVIVASPKVFYVQSTVLNILHALLHAVLTTPSVR